MSARHVSLRLTPAQARCVNSALALLEAEVESDRDSMSLHGLTPGVLDRTRALVHDALDAAGVEA